MLVALLLAVAVPLTAGDGPLFPVPLHLVRRIDDPISNKTGQVDEYCSGNRIITVDGYKTVIVDYDRRELLEIDRARSEYSVARFDEVAAANAMTRPPLAPSRIATVPQRWSATPLGIKPSSSGRSAESFEIAAGGAEPVKIELSVDTQVAVSRKAFDALIGAAYPNEVSGQQEALARAAARTRDVSAAEAAVSYGLPLEQVVTFDIDAHTHLTIRNAVISVTNDLPPPEALAIPAGAKLVLSRAARMEKSLTELKDAIPPRRPK